MTNHVFITYILLQLVNKNGFKNSSLTTDIMAYSPTSFYDLIKKFSQPDLTKIITGYLVMVRTSVFKAFRFHFIVFAIMSVDFPSCGNFCPVPSILNVSTQSVIFFRLINHSLQEATTCQQFCSLGIFLFGTP